MSRARPSVTTTAADPAHLYAHSSDDTSICGIKRPCPVVLACHAQAHVDGRGAVICVACAAGHVEQLAFDALEASA